MDNIDLDAATEKGIMVVNSPESTSITVAEHTLGLLLSMARKLSIADKSVKEGKWEKKRFMGVEHRNKTLGVIGMGRIGSQVVNRCKAFEMDAVIVQTSSEKKEIHDYEELKEWWNYEE